MRTRTVACAVACAVAVAVPLTGPIAQASAVPLSASTAPTYVWPSMRGDTANNGVNGDPGVSTATAPNLGVSWMTPTGSPILSSPVAAYNAALSKTLVYVGNDGGVFEAVDQATGTPVWSVALGSPIRSSALAEGSSVWVAPSAAGRVYKLNAATGAVECSAPVPVGLNVDSSPIVATPPGGIPTVYIGVNDAGAVNGPLLGIDESNCSVLFASTHEPVAGSGGIWDPISYGVDATGEPLVLFGTADPDSAVYAVDAVTGAAVWRFASENPPPGTYDVGAGVVVSPPGSNGFADGVAYVESKYGFMYALDLTTGAEIWGYDFGSPRGSLSTAALSGTDLVTGTPGGVDDINAVTGALKWRFADGDANDVDSSPIVTGPPGGQVVTFTTLTGVFDVVSLATGTLLYQYQTGSFATGSFADVNGNLVETGGNGFLYDLAPGGGNGVPPTASVTSPTDSSTVPNPLGSLTITGTASGSAVGSVDVGVKQAGAAGLWWDSATSSWTPAPYPNPATLASPGTASTTWTASVPVPAAGGGFTAYASALLPTGQADTAPFQNTASPGRVDFTVAPSPPPAISLSSSWLAPGQTVKVSGAGFAASENVTLSFGASFAETVKANTAGALVNLPIMVPGSTPFGLQTLVAKGLTSGLSTTTTFTVANTWSQFLGGPAHLGTDPNDEVFNKHLSVSSNSYLTPAWTFNAGASVRSSVSVVNGVAFFGTDGGAVYAVNIHSGTQLWRYQDVGGKPIDSSPAVAGSDVVFGTAAGSVVDLNAATGAVRWVKTYAHGLAVESSPTVVNGVVYVGSDNDMVTALNQAAKGAVIWQTAMGGPVKSSPAVDPKAGLLVVGSDNGKVSALSLATGALRWSFQTGGPVDASPAISSGTVYIGSADHSLYALHETTGALVWSYATGGAITASASVLGANIIVGSADNNVYWLSAATGSVTYTIRVGGIVSGVAAAPTFDVAVMTNGQVQGSKPAATDNVAWLIPPLSTTATIASSPTLVNGEVFITRQDGSVTCYTVPGSPPT